MHHYLTSLFRPASVAVVGVSAREERPANGVIKGLIDGGFEGRVYAVGSGTGHASLNRSYPTVDDLPEAPDVIFSAVSAARTPEVMLAAARKGVRFGIVFTAGFAEMSEQGSAREAEMVRACRELGMRIVGPNCMG